MEIVESAAVQAATRSTTHPTTHPTTRPTTHPTTHPTAHPAAPAGGPVAPSGSAAADGIDGVRARRGRERVFETLLSRGPITARDLARHLEVTPAAVRRHLDALVGEGLVTVRASVAVERGRGRPARSYVVTAAGQRAAATGRVTGRRPATGYEEAALLAVGHLAGRYGQEAVRTFARERMNRLEERWRGVVDAAGPDPLDRARALARALSADGFAAEAREVPPRAPAAGPALPTGTTGRVPGVQLCQGHCPVHALAEEHPEFCDAETLSFARLVGGHVQRLATLAHGDHVCTTFVPDPRALPRGERVETLRAAAVTAAESRTAGDPEGDPHDHRS